MCSALRTHVTRRTALLAVALLATAGAAIPHDSPARGATTADVAARIAYDARLLPLTGPSYQRTDGTRVRLLPAAALPELFKVQPTITNRGPSKSVDATAAVTLPSGFALNGQPVLPVGWTLTHKQPVTLRYAHKLALGSRNAASVRLPVKAAPAGLVAGGPVAITAAVATPGVTDPVPRDDTAKESVAFIPEAPPAFSKSSLRKALTAGHPRVIGTADAKGAPPSGSGEDAVHLAAAARLARIDVAVLQEAPGAQGLAGVLATAHCRWVSGPAPSFRSKRPVSGRCRKPVWLHATGISHFEYALAHALPKGRYVVYARATDGAGFRSREFKAALGDRVVLTVP